MSPQTYSLCVLPKLKSTSNLLFSLPQDTFFLKILFVNIKTILNSFHLPILEIKKIDSIFVF